MTAADDYNAKQLASGALSISAVTTLVRHWQATHGLVADGMAGPQTITSIAGRWLRNPLPVLADGRRAVITSEFRPVDRPSHNGVDLFYAWRSGDRPDFVGDHGCAGRGPDGLPKWVIPYGTLAVAAAGGRVMQAGSSPTGYRCWVDHGNGQRTGYFHLIDLRVSNGQIVETGNALGLVGDNPSDHDARHLHFELSPVSSYSPVDPAPFLIL